MEFASIDEERRYFARHGMSIEDVEQQIALGGGDLLVFDNLAVAHGRQGRRAAKELHQLCIGFRYADVAQQTEVMGRLVEAFRANNATDGDCRSGSSARA